MPKNKTFTQEILKMAEEGYGPLPTYRQANSEHARAQGDGLASFITLELIDVTMDLLHREDAIQAAHEAIITAICELREVLGAIQ